MAKKEIVIALGLIVAASPVAASVQAPARVMGAPAGTPDTLYCMRIEAVTGSRVDRVKCWTRERWAENEVDLDEEWAEEGVGIISNGVWRPANG